jgi:hypothetical protein
MSKTPRINGRKCRSFVQERKAFQNSNGQLYGKWETPDLYVVYSYGEHWPLFMWAGRTDTWYQNADKFSPTTSRHSSYAHPHEETELVGCYRMKQIIDAYRSAHRHEVLAVRQEALALRQSAALHDVQSRLELAA